MKTSRILTVILVLFLTFSLGVGRSTAQESGPGAVRQAVIGTGFTYQGQLKTSGGSPITTTCDFQFTLWDALSGPTQVGAASTVTGVSVVNGVFTAQVNTGSEFGATAFGGAARWLEIGVKCSGESSFTILSPRQPLTPAPYALALPGLRTEENAASPNVIGGYSGNTVASGVVGATIGGGGWTGYINSVTANLGTVSGGFVNTASGGAASVGGGIGNTASGSSSTASGGEGNLASNQHATVGGGMTNTASGIDSTVSGGESNAASYTFSTVGGGQNNTANGDHATVSGGESNTASGLGTIGGGRNNTAGLAGTIGGGQNNTAGLTGTIGGGFGNNASAQDSTVGGGQNNTASGPFSTLGGGNANTASGTFSTLGGGNANNASGQYATVAGGYQTSATHYGETAHASGQFVSPNGEAQASEYVLRNATSNATLTELFLDGVSQRITLVSSQTLSFDILIVAHASNGASAGYQITGLIENVAGTTTIVGTPQFSVLGEDVPAWNANVVADNANDALEIQVTGEAGVNIHWVASVRTVEVSW